MRTLKSPSIITLHDYASAAAVNLHEPTRGIGDGRTDR